MTDESVAQLKEILIKQGTVFDSDDAYREVGEKLIDFYTLLAEWDVEDQKLQRRLKDEPKGFAVPGECRTCHPCGRHIDDDMWYDKWGVKCMSCQNALDRKIIPGYVFRDHAKRKHTTAYALTGYGIHAATIRKLIRRGELKAREIPDSEGTLVFLRKDNPNLADIVRTHSKAEPYGR